jgi:hypothetical protein
LIEMRARQSATFEPTSDELESTGTRRRQADDRAALAHDVEGHSPSPLAVAPFEGAIHATSPETSMDDLLGAGRRSDTRHRPAWHAPALADREIGSMRALRVRAPPRRERGIVESPLLELEHDEAFQHLTAVLARRTTTTAARHDGGSEQRRTDEGLHVAFPVVIA